MFTPKAVQAGSSDTGTEAANLINRSGLRNRDMDSLDEHSVDPSQMWLCAKGETSTWVEFDLGEVQPLGTISIWNYNDAWHTDRGVRKADISVWTQETGWQKIHDDLAIEQAQGSDDYDEPVCVKLDAVKAQKIRFDDLASFGDADYVGLSEVQFFGPLGPQAVRPSPPDGAVGVSASGAILRWTAGADAVAHNLYLGVDPQNLELLGKVDATLAELSALAPDTTYYWRIDEVQADGASVSGRVWRFATGGLVTWWKLDESEGDRVTDASGHDHVGTVLGNAAWRPTGGRLGGALEFDGRDDCVEDASAAEYLNGLSAVTVALWVKSNTQDDDRDILFTREPTGDDNRLGLRYDKEGTFGGGKRCIKASVGVTTGEAQIESASDVQCTDWQHLALVWEHGSNVKLYINGVLNHQPTHDSGPVMGTLVGIEKLMLGRGAKNIHWDGLIDDVRIYSYALADEQVRAAAAGETPSTTVAKVTLKVPRVMEDSEKKLLAWWKLDESEGTKVADSSGQSRNAVIYGSPAWQPADGRIGGALGFDGVDDYVDTGWADHLPMWTVAVWVKSPAAPKSSTPVGPVHREKNFQINWDHGNDVFRGAAGVRVGGTWYGASFGELKANTWHHLTATYDGESLKAYRDGTLVTENTDPSGDADPDPATLTLGRHAIDTEAFFAGAIDDVRIYNYALPAEQVRAAAAGEAPSMGTEIEKKLVAWWKLDESEGSAVSDSSGTDARGVLMGNPRWQPAGGKVAGALEFDGSNDYVEIADRPAFQLVDQITVAAWIKVRKFNTSFQTIVAKGDTTWRISGDASGDVLIFATGHDSRLHVARGSLSVNDGQWHHVVGVHDGQKVSLYVDGHLDGFESTTDKIPTSGRPITIGENAGFRGRYWSGMIDDVRIYNYAMSPEQVVALHDGKDPMTAVAARMAPSAPILAQAASPDANEPVVSAPLPAAPAQPQAQIQPVSVESSAAEAVPQGGRNWIALLVIVGVVGVIAGASFFAKQKTQ